MLIANNVYDYVQSGNGYSGSFKPSVGHIKDASLAAEFLQVLITGMDSHYFWLSLEDTREHI